MRLLLVEDTRDVADAIAATFARGGVAVDVAATMAEAIDFLNVQAYEVIILDINLPDGSGTDILAGIRSAGTTTPVLMLTAQFSVEDRVSALDQGADDYVVKPFDLRELEARVRALSRREGEAKTAAITAGHLVFDPAAQTAHVCGTPLTLTRREFSLLQVLLSNRDRVMSKDRLFDHLFSFEEAEVGMNAIELYVARLRKKLGGSGVSIRTLRGLGYQLVVDD